MDNSRYLLLNKLEFLARLTVVPSHRVLLGHHVEPKVDFSPSSVKQNPTGLKNITHEKQSGQSEYIYFENMIVAAGITR